MRSVFRPIAHSVVGQALWLALLWTYVGLLVAGAVLGLTALSAAIVVVVGWAIGTDAPLSDTVWQAVRVAVYIAGPLVLAAGCWAAAYGSTDRGAWSRTIVATFLGLATGGALTYLGSSAGPVAALAFGWAAAILSSSLVRVALRGLPVVGVALLALGAEGATLDEFNLFGVIGLLAVTPLLAALFVWSFDGLWSGAAAWRLRFQGSPEDPDPVRSSLR